MQHAAAGQAHVGGVHLDGRAEHGLQAGRNLAGDGLGREVNARRDIESDGDEEQHKHADERHTPKELHETASVYGRSAARPGRPRQDDSIDAQRFIARPAPAQSEKVR